MGAKANTGSELATVTRTSTDLAQLDELESILLGNTAPPEVVDDPTAVSQEIVAQLLGATSDAELEAFGKAISWRDLAVPMTQAQAGGGVPVRLDGFRWRPSDYDEGAPVFFVVQGTALADGPAVQLPSGDMSNLCVAGEKVTLTTGALNVLAQLTNRARRGTLVGAVVTICEADEKTKAGFVPLWLVTAPGHEPVDTDYVPTDSPSAPDPAAA